MNIGLSIKELRKQQHISAERLAEVLGVHPSTIYRYEKGDIEKIPYTVLVPIAKVLGVSPVDLLGLEDEQSVKEEHLLSSFRKMSPEQQEAILLMTDSMIINQDEK